MRKSLRNWSRKALRSSLLISSRLGALPERALVGYAGLQARNGRRVGGPPHVRLTPAVAARALEEIDVDVILMKAIRAGPQHGRELADACLRGFFAKIIWNVRIRQFQYSAIGQSKQAYIQRVSLAMHETFPSGAPLWLRQSNDVRVSTALRG